MIVRQTSQFIWDFSERSDIFNIRKTGRKTNGSAELGDFTVDFDEYGEIIGIEIMNVSDFLRQAAIPLEELEQLKAAQFWVQEKGNVTYLWIKLVLSGGVERNIPIPVPVMEMAV